MSAKIPPINLWSIRAALAMALWIGWSPLARKQERVSFKTTPSARRPASPGARS